MTPPDLATPEGRTAYARELAGIARPFRWLGLALVAAGVATLALVPHSAGRVIGWSLIGFGWVQVLIGVAIRRAYHAKRMRAGTTREPSPRT